MKLYSMKSLITLILFSVLTQAQSRTTFLLPDDKLTPGAVLTTDKALICKHGYTQTVRNVSLVLKRKVMEIYGKTDRMSNYEIDHLIPLELGGSNSINNLWPQPIAQAKVKDVLENILHVNVCRNMMPLSDVQQRIASDWVQLYKDTRLSKGKK